MAQNQIAILYGADVIERRLANDGVAGDQRVGRPSRSSARPAIPRQGIHLGDRGAIGHSLSLRLRMSPAAVAGTVPGEPVTHHDSLEIGAIEVTDRDAPIIRSLPGQLASNLFAEHERFDGFRGFSGARFIPLRRRDSLKANRHISQLDGVAVPNIGDLPDRPAFR
jgi:hypothetical protein